MAVRIAKVDATPAVPIIQLAVLRIPRMAAVCQAGLLHPLKNGVEFVIAHVKCVMMGFERIVLIEIKREPVIYPHRSEMPC